MMPQSDFTKPPHNTDRAGALARAMTLRQLAGRPVGDRLRELQEVAVTHFQGSALVAPAFGTIVGRNIATAPLALHSWQWFGERREEVAARPINDW